MTNTLAIFTPKLGERSETFIQRHIEELWPGRTVVVAGSRAGAQWSTRCPALILDELPAPRFAKVLIRSLREKAGWRGEVPEVKAVREFLRHHGVQVAMGEYLNASLAWVDVCQEMNIPFFAHAHGYDVSLLLRDPYWCQQYLRYNRCGAGIITMSQVSRDRLLKLGLEAPLLHVVPYGVDVMAVPPARSHSDHLVRCLAVGRMVAKKAPVLCLDAFRRAAQTIPGLRLTYVGDGSLLSAARQFVQALGMQDKVSLLGGQPAEVVQRLMAESDIFLQHSMTDVPTGDQEGLPVSILEAMAHGLPVVSTRHAGIPEAVIEQLTGLLVEEGDSVGMAQCLMTLAGDESLRRQMGRDGWIRAKERFTWQRERDSLRAILGLQPPSSGIS